ncbi:hypothetical protein [Arenibacterium sp. LLYu02]|uniref:hypothetical protein n=1 Tax=Arenibacterium sp. LLYu02 TaxID=3404132 RepID=UPI003B22351B
MSHGRLMPAWFFAAVGFFITATAVLAHHGFDGRYDLGTPVWIEGTVESAYFGPPHSELTIRLDDPLAVPESIDLGAAGTFIGAYSLVLPDAAPGEIVEAELPPTSQYAALGGRLGVGDRIAAVALRNCSPPYQLNIQWLRLADDSVESRRAPMSYMVETC